jgi:hypothetical protein
MAVRRIVSLAENGHSNVSTGSIFGFYGLLPIRTYWFTDGLYIVRARSDHAGLLGTRITAIDSTSVKKLRQQLGDYWSGTTALFKRWGALPIMLSPAVLHAAGLAARPDRLTLKVESADGSSFRSTVITEVGPVPVNITAPWRYLDPAPLPGEAGNWSTARSSAKLPLRLRERNEPFRYVLLKGNIAYIQLRQNASSATKSLRDFLTATRTRLEEDRPRSIVFDNRDNTGGSLNLTGDFALSLPDLASPGGRVYSLIGNSTFSAGIYSSFFPVAADPDRTLVVGATVGDNARFWADGASINLPDTGYTIGYSSFLHDVGSGCHELPDCLLAQRGFPPRFNIAVGSIAPELNVPLKFKDYLKGKDRQLKKVLKLARAD